jgi:hypothetical protein
MEIAYWNRRYSLIQPFALYLFLLYLIVMDSETEVAEL